MDKTERAEWLKKTLNDRNVPMYGRASTIARELQCAKAVSTGWLTGALPRDMTLGFKFADRYDFDVREWVTGHGDDLQTRNWGKAIKTARAFEKVTGTLEDEQFLMIVNLAMTKEDDELATVIEQLGTILKNT